MPDLSEKAGLSRRYRRGAVGVIWCGLGFLYTYVGFFFLIWFHLRLSKIYFKILTIEKRTFHLKPQTALKFEENRDPQTLRNRKPHMKPYLQGTKTVTLLFFYKNQPPLPPSITTATKTTSW